MQVDLGIAFGIVGCIVGVIGSIVGVAGWVRNRDSDKGGSVKAFTKVEVLLETVLAQVKEIGTRLTQMECVNQDVLTRLARVEESAKSAHHRLDELPKGGTT